MKHFQIFAAVAALSLLAACSIKEDRTDCSLTAPVSVHVNDFALSLEDFPTKTTQTAAAYSGVKALTLAFYQGASEAYKETQIKGALEDGETFGEFSLSLPMGSYTMVVIGHGLNDGEPAVTLTSPTSASFGDYPARETFACTEGVNINSSSAIDIGVTLERIVTKLQVASSDARVEGAVSVRMTFAAGGKAFSPASGLALSDSGFSNTVGISSAVGATSLSNSYLFLSSDDQDIDVTLETLDADGNTLFSKTITGVPFQRNRVTILTGAMYTNSGIGGSFQLNTDWLAGRNLSF